MADALGHLSKMAIFNVSGWTSAYPGGTGDTVHYNSETLTEEYERLERKGLVGKGGAEPSDQGNVEVTGTTLHELDYVNFNIFWRYWFGDTSSPYDISDDTLPHYYWIEIDKQVERWRFGACKLNAFTLRGPDDGKIMLELEHTCRKADRTATALSGDAMGSTARTLFKQTQFRLADQVDAIGSGDIMQIDKFELAANRHLKTDDYASKDSLGDAIYKLEPVPGEKREITLSIGLPRYSASTLQDWKKNNTDLMADILSTNGTNSIQIQLPQLRAKEGFGAPTEGPGPYRQDGIFEVRVSENATMYVGNELRVTLV